MRLTAIVHHPATVPSDNAGGVTVTTTTAITDQIRSGTDALARLRQTLQSLRQRCCRAGWLRPLLLVVLVATPVSGFAQKSWTVSGADGELLHENDRNFVRTEKGIELKPGTTGSWLRYNLSGLFDRIPYFSGFEFELEFIDSGNKTKIEAFLIEHDPRTGQDQLVYKLDTNQFTPDETVQKRSRQLCNSPWRPDPSKYYFALARLSDTAQRSPVRPRLESITISTIDC